MHGKGEYTYVRGDRYIGQFLLDKFHGTGTLYYVSGEKYIGGWADGVKHGKGQAHLLNVVDEQWEKGSKCGILMC